jgi:hypothetical protein
MEMYRARIGSVLTRSSDTRAQQETEGEGAYWFLGLVLLFNVANINSLNTALTGNECIYLYVQASYI